MASIRIVWIIITSLCMVVTCSAALGCSHGAVRLSGGSSFMEGRVEVCIDENWNTFCFSESWDDNAASVICRQLGLSLSGSAESVTVNTNGSVVSGLMMWHNSTHCSGDEEQFIDCPAIMRHQFQKCSSSNYVGVKCEKLKEDKRIKRQTVCTNGDVRLVGGSTAYEGRVELCYNNAWGTVCDDLWGVPDANVVCGQLGYINQGATTRSFGSGTGSILLDNVQCSGTESSLLQCPNGGIGVHDCAHSEDAGVVCLPSACSTSWDIRLVGRPTDTEREGRVEVCLNGVWGTICDDSWDDNDAGVVCAQVGYSRQGSTSRTSNYYGYGLGPVQVANVQCTGTETDLRDCSLAVTSTCGQSANAGVTCVVCPPGDIRLVGGSVADEGRVELCLNNAWGTICDDGFDINDANVICRQLGYPDHDAIPRLSGYFGQGTGSIFRQYLQCSGSESRLVDCSTSSTTISCTHSEDAGVQCLTTVCSTNWELRLVNGSNVREGRLEVCLNGVWGTVCDDSWDDTDAGVVCSQMGYSRLGSVAHRAAYFGSSSYGPVSVGNTQCSGSETRLQDCGLSQTPGSACTHSQDAGVTCVLCVSGNVRLVRGSTVYEGRVELCYNSAWGTVCDDHWDAPAANVVCGQLGYQNQGATARSSAFFGQGVGPIFLDNVGCSGTESRLLDCAHNEIGTHDCSHSEDAGVICLAPECSTDWELRLVGGTNVREGRLEVCLNGVWGTICDQSWDNTDAGVICTDLGYSRQGSVATSSASFGQGDGPIHISNIRCNGSETQLQACAYSLSNSCTHSSDAGIMCVVCVNGNVRLVGGSTAYEGLVELCYNNAWGTVCDDLWDSPDANVVCGQLGYQNQGATARSSAFFGQGVGSIFLDNVGCSGTESRLIDCAHSGIGSHDCSHSEDAGVTCLAPDCSTDWELRLVGGTNVREGRLEVCLNGVWGTICDQSWDNTDAGVICTDLGYSRLGSVATSSASFGQGDGPIHISNVQCNGSETQLQACAYSLSNSCTHSSDAGIMCVVCVSGNVRLVGGSTAYEGRVELCYNNAWGTVCDDFWDSPDANVVCGQLGFQNQGATARNSAFFGQGVGSIFLDNVGCSGTESRLIDCAHVGIGSHDCSHSEDAGVTCLAPDCSTDWELRLLGGTNVREGRLEVCLNGVWGTICDQSWDNTDAGVICTDLGYSRQGSVATSSASFGQGDGPIHISNVQCNGSETQLQACAYSLSNSCTHSSDAGIMCVVCPEGNIRLIGGSAAGEGRVELCTNNAWGTVCDDGWDTSDANVVCRQLGFPDQGATPRLAAHFGSGTGSIVRQYVRCTGSESRLVDCPTGSSSCTHSEDAGVTCLPTICSTDWEMRLVNGGSSLEGRLEVCLNGVWGTICDQSWDDTDAGVACSQMGYSARGSVARHSAYFDEGFGPVQFTSFQCNGTETRLRDCPYTIQNTCTHSADAGVTCVVCPPDDIRLVGGSVADEGRVELCNNNAWGTVCDDGFDERDANVVCRQLGYPDQDATPRLSAHFGQGTGSILRQYLQCSGTESRLVDCPTSSSTCTHNEDVGVTCLPTVCSTDWEMRLVNGGSSLEGRLEVCLNGVWGTICDQSWDDTDAGVVCSQMGHSARGSVARHSAYFDEGFGPVQFTSFQCNGTETRLRDCPYTIQNTCTHSTDAGVTCVVCPPGDIRLVGGSVADEGRVELCNNNAWGTICDDGFDERDANVVCRQLGYPDQDATPRPAAHFGQGTGSILRQYLQCSGTESRLVDCPTSSSTCTHIEDAGVTCLPTVCSTDWEMRLVNGGSSLEGRLEVCLNGIWGTICDQSWDDTDAGVACSQMGHSARGSVARGSAYFDEGFGPVQFTSFQCNGTETRLRDCPYTIQNTCTHSSDAGVTCVVCPPDDIRLVGGSVADEGRVELCYNNAWGTICDDGFDINDANVICRQLGYPDHDATPRLSAYFGQGTGSILRQYLLCSGTESRLVDCPTSSSTCTHSEDAGVTCLPTVCSTDWELRLVNGGSNLEGRLEVCLNGVWGTICDQSWDDTDAGVVCSQMGHSARGSVARRSAYFDEGFGPVQFTSFQCNGTETRLRDCPYTIQNTCTHSTDAGVTCVVCPPGDIRLVGGSVADEGRVELCLNNAWGTICDDGFDINDANVICRQLGYPDHDATPRLSAYFGQGTGSILRQYLRCSGTESRIIDCPTSSSTCTHSEDAGVTCLPTVCSTDWELRLVNGGSSLEGRLEVCLNGVWGTICDQSWDDTDAGVVCSQMGYSARGSVARPSAYFEEGIGPVQFTNFQCDGTETRLRDCPNTIQNTCTHSADAGVTCVVCPSGDIRLVGGSVADEGRVELCLNNAWGTICDDGFDIKDANVICRQLGYPDHDATPRLSAYFGQGTGSIFRQHLRCSGSESRLVDCSTSTSSCTHSEDAGVTCLTTVCSTNWELRLVNGSNVREGRLEVCLNGVWGTVCDDSWDDTDAGVVCSQMGYSRLGSVARRAAYFGSSSYGPVSVGNTQCSGSETRLQDCGLSQTPGSTCTHSQDAGITCVVCVSGNVRLVGGSTVYEGRVELCYNNAWGTVCDDLWDAPDANVVCGQLGYQNQGATARSSAFFGQGVGSIFLDNVGCSGTESRLIDCAHIGIGSHDCSHSEDAGVTCLAPECSTDWELRLVGGTNVREGRLEVCLNGAWGTICDQSWDNTDAGVICAGLGYSRQGSVATSSASFGQGDGPIHISNVQCNGSETQLQACAYSLSNSCTHSSDAGIMCVVCASGNVRLVGGSTAYEGRVELCYNSAWGTVCDDLWDSPDANVVCGQLGYQNQGATARSSAFFGQGVGSIFLDNVGCSGTESRLIDCAHSGIGSHDCSHSEDAGVTCLAPDCSTDWELRLVGGTNVREGRLEVCLNGVWGTICDQSWDNTDAGVICTGLGYSRQGSVATSSASFGQGDGPIHISNIRCNGSETQLQACAYSLSNSCTHSSDAGIMCVVCASGNVRLVGGSTAYEGRVELCYNSAWGTVCDDLWDSPDANVVCGQLGYQNQGATARSSAFFGQGVGSIFLDSVGCSGTESRLIDCAHSGIGSHDCSHSEDAGVTCLAPDCSTDWELRLVGGTNVREGRLEVCLNGVWGTICDQSWDNTDAGVICTGLGYSRQGSVATSSASFGQGDGPIHISNVQCNGSETQLQACAYSLSNSCTHSSDAGIMCVVCASGNVRLVGGSTAYEGRVELCYNSAWGTVCDDLWDSPDAYVVCGQLGYQNQGATARSSAFFGQGVGSIFLDSVGCSGTESRLIDCAHSGIGSHDCSHSEDAGVTCLAPDCSTDWELRLVGGTNVREGRLEVCLNGVWGTICDQSWDNTDAGVICAGLGYSRQGSVATSSASFGQGDGPIHISNIQCNGSETQLQACAYFLSNSCTHSSDAGIMCVVCASGNVRLVGGSTAYEGRVELCYNSAWGTVCDDSWGTSDANVVCRQLGFSGQGATARVSAFFGAGIGQIFLDNVGCLGTESRLIDCSNSGIGVHDCSHSEDAGVTCQSSPTTSSPPCPEWEVRIVGGANEREGRVEVCLNGVWGTVCDESWSSIDAGVVCNQFGYPRETAVARVSAYFGQGSGPIQIDGVQCTGTESELRNCSYTQTNKCGHSADVGVTCNVCSSGDIRMAGGSLDSEGRVEVCYNHQWGTVCDNGWDPIDANIACNQLGFSRFNANATTSAVFGPGMGPVLLENVTCTGNEDRLFDCMNSGLGVSSCPHSRDAGIRCSTQSVCSDGDVRLVGGSSNYIGRVEICIDEIWGTVCNDFWDSTDAGVICTQLGYSRYNAVAISTTIYGQGTGPIFIDDLACAGSETNILQCSNDRDTSDCTHSDDAGVQCREQKLCEDGALRLVGGSSTQQGRVEVCYNEVWGTVCDTSFDATDASVICRQLGFSSRDAVAMTMAAFGQGSGPVLISSLQCYGNESYLLDCPGAIFQTTSPCQHSRDVGVTCNERPSYPSNVVASAVSSTSISVTWGVPAEFQSSIVNYRIQCRRNSTGLDTTTLTVNNSTYSLTASSLSPYTTYTCCVEAIYTDISENSMACDTITTMEGVPGPPINLNAVPSQENCRQAIFTWDPPLELNGIIRHYRLRVTATDNSFDHVFISDITSITVTILNCCTSYTYSISAFTVMYGPASVNGVLQTLPDLSNAIMVESTVVNSNQISVTWVTPQSNIDQGVSLYQIMITPLCLNGGDTRTFTATPSDPSSITLSGLDALSLYRLQVIAVVCQFNVEVYNQTVQTPGVVPVITSAMRSSASSARVSFTISESPGSLEVSLYLANDTTVVDESQLVSTTQTNEREITFQNLDICSTYWIIVTAVNCGLRIRSEPYLLASAQLCTTTEPPTTTPEATTTEPSTTTPEVTTIEPLTTTPEATTTESPTTTFEATTTEPPTTMPEATTTEHSTTKPEMTTTEPSTTTLAATTTEPLTTKPEDRVTTTTTEASTTTSEATTTEPPTTTPEATTTEPPITTPEAITTEAPTTTPEATTTEPSTTTPEVTTTEPLSTTPEATTTEPLTTTPEVTTTEPLTAMPEATTTEPLSTTPEATTTEPSTTTPEATTTEPLTTMPEATTTEPPTTTPEVTTTEPSTTTPEATTTEPPTTTPEATTTEPSTTTPEATTTEPLTTTPEATTTEPLITTPEATTTEPLTTMSEATTTEPPSTTPEATTTEPSTTTPEATTTEPPTTTPEATTTEPPTTTPEATTTEPPTTTPEATTTEPPTTTPEATDSESPTTVPIQLNTDAGAATSSAIPIYVWPVVIIAIAAVIIAIVLAIVMFWKIKRNKRVLFSYMEDTRAIHNPIYSDTDGAYPDSKEDEARAELGVGVEDANPTMYQESTSEDGNNITKL